VAVPSEDKVEIAVMYWKGKADYWWRGAGCTPVALPWHHFCRMLEDIFLEISSAEIIGQFYNLKQTSTIPEYIDKFEEFMRLDKRNNPSLPEEYFVSSFIVGLKDFIQHHLQCHKPSSLTQAFWFARRLEQANPQQKRYTVFPQMQKLVKQWTKEQKPPEPKDAINPTSSW